MTSIEWLKMFDPMVGGGAKHDSSIFVGAASIVKRLGFDTQKAGAQTLRIPVAFNRFP
jgi:hypothetical protein